jgi:diguanylate cyclase (GGDEF)-like protein
MTTLTISPASRRALSYPYFAALILLLIVLAILYIGSMALRLVEQKRLLEAQAAQNITNVALSMQRSMDWQLAHLLALQARIASQITEHFPDDLQDASRARISALQSLLTQEARGNDDTELLGVASADGRVQLMSSDVTSMSAGDRIDLSTWRAHPAQASHVGIYAGGPRSSWPSGFLVTSPVRRADGSVRAYVFALQSHESYRRRMREQQRAGFSLGPNSFVAIADVAANRLAFRQPMGAAVIGQIIPPYARSGDRRDPRLYHWISPFDHHQVMGYQVSLVGGAFTMLVAVAEQDFLAPWYSELVFSAMSSTALLLAIALLLYMARQDARHARQLLHDKEQIAIGARTLGDLINSAPIALAQVRLHDGKLLHTNRVFDRLVGALPGPAPYAVEALFVEPSAWEELSASTARDASVPRRHLELTLKTGDTTRRALVSAAKLPSRPMEQPVVLLTITDNQAQHARTQALSDIAFADALTRLPNRRAFFKQAEATFAVARRHDRMLALLMIDLDHFKRVNDTYGHAAGDAVLARAADCLRQSLRESDLPARLGGEEFVVMLPETSLANAAATAERIRLTIEQAPPAVWDGQAIPVTASIGVAMMRGDSQDIGAILHEADLALYQAKQDGRNRVACAAPAPADAPI